MREKLIELLNEVQDYGKKNTYEENSVTVESKSNEKIAAHLIANGVTIQKWIPVSERLPENFVSVLGYMTDAGEFPPVRECYTVGNAFYFPALCDKHPVSHWMPLPEPPKEE